MVSAVKMSPLKKEKVEAHQITEELDWKSVGLMNPNENFWISNTQWITITMASPEPGRQH